MAVLGGCVFVLVAVLAGFSMAGGKVGSLIHPSEFVTIGGAALGALIVVSPGRVLKDLARSLAQLLKGSPYNKAAYVELFKALYALSREARQGGILALDSHVSNPDGSPIFQQCPRLSKNHHAMQFLCDALSLIVDGKTEAAQFTGWLEEEIRVREREHHAAVSALSKTADALPGFGIVAAVLGIVVTMTAIGGPVYTVGETGGVPYLVMEYIEGVSLAERLLREAPLPLPEIIRVGLQTASGLSVAHAGGLVHRDIKPANLLLEEATRRVKIVDFGLAKIADRVQLSRPGTLLGTPDFMSPEQAEGKPTDSRSDMFSLGSVLYVASTGQMPFDADSDLGVLRAICETHPVPVRAVNPVLPGWLEELIAGLMTKDPARRYPTASELKRLLLSRWARLYRSRGTQTVPAGQQIAAQPSGT
jgi:chemotaxis protein MotA